MDHLSKPLIGVGLGIALTVLSGCSYKTTSVYERSKAPPPGVASPSGQPRDAASAESSSVQAQSEGAATEGGTSRSRPVGELLAKAELERSGGQLPQAEATLERAMRIAPKDPLLWQRLAEIRLEQGDAQQAEALARKSNALVTLDTSLMHRNWQIIAQARRMRGDEEGAQDAERRARNLGLP